MGASVTFFLVRVCVCFSVRVCAYAVCVNMCVRVYAWVYVCVFIVLLCVSL